MFNIAQGGGLGDFFNFSSYSNSITEIYGDKWNIIHWVSGSEHSRFENIFNTNIKSFYEIILDKPKINYIHYENRWQKIKDIFKEDKYVFLDYADNEYLKSINFVREKTINKKLLNYFKNITPIFDVDNLKNSTIFYPSTTYFSPRSIKVEFAEEDALINETMSKDEYILRIGNDKITTIYPKIESYKKYINLNEKISFLETCVLISLAKNFVGISGGPCVLAAYRGENKDRNRIYAPADHINNIKKYYFSDDQAEIIPQ